MNKIKSLFFLSFFLLQSLIFAQNKKKVNYLFDLGAGISNQSVQLYQNYNAPIGLNAALNAYIVKPKLGIRLRLEGWLRLDKAENDYMANYTKSYDFIPYHYELFAIEAYKTLTISKKDVNIGAGIARIYPYYFYVPKIDVDTIPNTNIPYYTYVREEGSGARHFATVFCNMPFHWFNLELRANIPLRNKPILNSVYVRYIKGVTEGRINLTLTYTFGKKYYENKK